MYLVENLYVDAVDSDRQICVDGAIPSGIASSAQIRLRLETGMTHTNSKSFHMLAEKNLYIEEVWKTIK